MKTSIMNRILFASVCSVAMTSTAFAQAAAEDQNSDEIVVTAQNREQSINDVPIAINVIGAEELQEAGFAGMNDINKIAPVVQLNQDQGTVKVTIRGVGTNSNDEAQDTSVVVNIDGEYMNRPQVLGIAIFDLDRVEVLRGPQGTLYGRNSTGGAINFITRKPGSEAAVNGSLSYGNYDAIRADLGSDIPLGEVGAVRVAGFYEKRDGYVGHPSFVGGGSNPAGFAGGRSDDNDAFGGRISLRLEPSEALTFNLAGEYADRTYTPQAFAYVNLNARNAGQIPVGTGPNALFGVGPAGPGCNAPGFIVPPGVVGRTQTLCIPSGTNFLPSFDRSNFAAPLFGLGRFQQDTYALRARAEYKFSDAATLTYVGGLRSVSSNPNNIVTLPVVYRTYNYQGETDTQSHELRLNGNVGGVIYQVGGFYFKEKLKNESCFLILVGANGTCNSYFGRDISSDSKSIFGQVEVPFGDTLTAVAGLRYTSNKRRAFYVNGAANIIYNYDSAGNLTSIVRPTGFPFINAALFNTGGVRKPILGVNGQRLNLASKENAVTWLAGLNYKPNADTLIFGKISKGFKGGGFDSVGTYLPETNIAVELGWKQSFGARSQNQFNLGAFHYDYKDLQVAVLLDTAVGGQIFNAGKAKIWGLEAEAVFELSDNDTFTASVNYLNAEYKDLRAQFNVFTVAGTGADVTGIGDLDLNTAGVQQPNFAGNRPAFSPKFIFTAGYDHVFDLGDSGKITASVNTMLKSSYFTDFFNYSDGRQKAFMQTDLSLTYKPVSKSFMVQAFIKNIENKRPLTYGSFVAAGPDDIYNWQFGTPRTYGIRVGIDF